MPAQELEASLRDARSATRATLYRSRYSRNASAWNFSFSRQAARVASYPPPPPPPFHPAPLGMLAARRASPARGIAQRARCGREPSAGRACDRTAAAARGADVTRARERAARRNARRSPVAATAATRRGERVRIALFPHHPACCVIFRMGPRAQRAGNPPLRRPNHGGFTACCQVSADVPVGARSCYPRRYRDLIGSRRAPTAMPSSTSLSTTSEQTPTAPPAWRSNPRQLRPPPREVQRASGCAGRVGAGARRAIHAH